MSRVGPRAGDPGAVRDYAQAAEDLGYVHLSGWEHVVGVDLPDRPDWVGPPTRQPIHEPLVLFGYVAALAWGWAGRSQSSVP